MPITAKSVTITTSPTAIHTAASNGCHIHLFSDSGGQDVTLGPATVVAGAGFTLTSSSKVMTEMHLPPGETLYGIVPSSTHAVRVTILEF